MDISIRLSNGQLLRGVIESPGENARAGIILVHGLGEHIGRYKDWMKRFSAKGIAWAGLDLPGHGRSDGKRGAIRNYSLVSEMLYILINEHRKTFPGLPLFLYGQSLGGGILLDYIIRKNPAIAGAVICSPFLKLSFEPSKIKILLASILNNVLKSFTQPSGLIAEHLSHDSRVAEMYKSDPLVHNRISAGLFHSAISASTYITSNIPHLKKPVLLLHGSGDLITSHVASRKLASENRNITLKIWEGGYHELHNETFRDEVFTEIIGWMNTHI